MPRILFMTAASLAALSLAACGDNMGGDNALMTQPTVETASVATASTENATREAQDVVNAAGQASLVEIRTSELALEKSSSADVKAFAQTMIDNHKAATDTLKAAASATALAPPTEMLDDFHMRRINDLVETDGDADFDADYAALQIDAHNDAIRLFEDYSRDPDATAQLKAFAEETLPTLHTHKAQAEKIRDLATKSDKSAT